MRAGGHELPPLNKLRILVCGLNSARDRLTDLVIKADWPRRMILVVDECHRASATQAVRIFDCKPRFALGLSATPEPDSDSDGLPADAVYNQGAVGRALGPIIFDFALKHALEAGLLTKNEQIEDGAARVLSSELAC